MSGIHVIAILALLIISILYNARHFAYKHYERKMTEKQAGEAENRWLALLIFIASCAMLYCNNL
jgi:hypothetical protein